MIVRSPRNYAYLGIGAALLWSGLPNTTVRIHKNPNKFPSSFILGRRGNKKLKGPRILASNFVDNLIKHAESIDADPMHPFTDSVSEAFSVDGEITDATRIRRTGPPEHGLTITTHYTWPDKSGLSGESEESAVLAKMKSTPEAARLHIVTFSKLTLPLRSPGGGDTKTTYMFNIFPDGLPESSTSIRLWPQSLSRALS